MDIRVPDIEVPGHWGPRDIEVPVILKWGGWVRKSASMRGTAGGVMVRGTSTVTRRLYFMRVTRFKDARSYHLIKRSSNSTTSTLFI